MDVNYELPAGIISRRAVELRQDLGLLFYAHSFGLLAISFLNKNLKTIRMKG